MRRRPARRRRAPARANPMPPHVFEAPRYKAPGSSGVGVAILDWIDLSQMRRVLRTRDGESTVVAPGLQLTLFVVDDAPDVTITFEVCEYALATDDPSFQGTRWHQTATTEEYEFAFDVRAERPSDSSLRTLGMAKWVAFAATPQYQAMMGMLRRMHELGLTQQLAQDVRALGWPVAAAMP